MATIFESFLAVNDSLSRISYASERECLIDVMEDTLVEAECSARCFDCESLLLIFVCAKVIKRERFCSWIHEFDDFIEVFVEKYGENRSKYLLLHAFWVKFRIQNYCWLHISIAYVDLSTVEKSPAMGGEHRLHPFGVEFVYHARIIPRFLWVTLSHGL